MPIEIIVNVLVKIVGQKVEDFLGITVACCPHKAYFFRVGFLGVIKVHNGSRGEDNLEMDGKKTKTLALVAQVFSENINIYYMV